MPSLFTAPPRLPLIAPSILSADFARMGDECRDVFAAGADLLHVDVMDGHFVPNLTMGPDMVRGVRAALPDAFLDVHLMVTHPANFVEPFIKAGANHITFHVEVVDPPLAQRIAASVRALGATVGMAINPPTPVDAILPYIPSMDLILVMSVNPGFSGQAFKPEVLEKVRAIKARQSPAQRLQMDGGIKPDNAHAVRSAGCDTIVAASAVFSAPRPRWPDVIRSLRSS